MKSIPQKPVTLINGYDLHEWLRNELKDHLPNVMNIVIIDKFAAIVDEDDDSPLYTPTMFYTVDQTKVVNLETLLASSSGGNATLLKIKCFDVRDVLQFAYHIWAVGAGDLVITGID